MLPMGSIFFPLRVAPMRLENNFKGHLIEKPPKLNLAFNLPPDGKFYLINSAGQVSKQEQQGVELIKILSSITSLPWEINTMGILDSLFGVHLPVF